MRCLSTGPGRFLARGGARGELAGAWFRAALEQLGQPAGGPVALLAHLLIVGHGATAFNLDAAGVVSVLDESDRVRRLSPDRDGLYDLVSLDCVCHRCAPAACAVMA